MTGALMVLTSKGHQDSILTQVPEVTLWKAVYRKHSRYATESVELQFFGAPQWGQKVHVDIRRKGDLLHKLFLKVKLKEFYFPAPDLETGHFGARTEDGNPAPDNVDDTKDKEVGMVRWVRHLGCALLKSA